MDVLRHRRSLTLLVFILATYYNVVVAEHRHRHHHNLIRHRRQHHAQYYYVENETPEFGEWGPWTPAGECTRSCGGGVAYEVRECYRSGCRGPSKRYYSCNIHDCAENVDFRAQQCSLFDTVPFDGFLYTWVPYTKSQNKCELNCMPRGDRFYYTHKKKVIDGTPCDDERTDICVNGKCLPIGCDRLLGSPAREDKCRVCGGDGSSCNTIKGILDRNDLVVGYNDLLVIPAGAMNIRVRELQYSSNYLAIRNLTGFYYLNGNWRIDFPRSLRFTGTVFHYERDTRGFFAAESISALGPISEPLYIVMLYQEKKADIEYEYSIPNGTIHTTDSDGYQWVYDDFTNCSAPCGGGYRTLHVWCAKKRDSSLANNDLCDPALKPSHNQTCAQEACPPRWVVSEWSQCSKNCGTDGIQNRTIRCEQILSNGKSAEVDNNLCQTSIGETPNTTRPCNVGLPCPKWYIGAWKSCDKLCGDGFQRRDVKCYFKINGKISIADDTQCLDPKPDVEKPCFVRPCEGVDWIVSSWSSCEDKCDVSFETRSAICASIKGKSYPEQYCKKSQLPQLIRECKTTPCEYQWYASQWSDCSSKCSAGIQSRKVFCGALKDDQIQKVNDSKCDIAKKYETTRNCTGTGVCEGEWFAGPWSKCSKPCGGGTMNRTVLCLVENKTVEVSKCKSEDIVFKSESCNNQPCGEDEIMPVVPNSTVSEESAEEECEEYEGDNVVTIPMNLNVNKDTKSYSVEYEPNPVTESKEFPTEKSIVEALLQGETIVSDFLAFTSESTSESSTITESSSVSGTTETSTLSSEEISSTDISTSSEASSPSSEANSSVATSSSSVATPSSSKASSSPSEANLSSVTTSSSSETTPSSSETTPSSSETTPSSSEASSSSSQAGSSSSEATSSSSEASSSLSEASSPITESSSVESTTSEITTVLNNETTSSSIESTTTSSTSDNITVSTNSAVSADISTSSGTDSSISSSSETSSEATTIESSTEIASDVGITQELSTVTNPLLVMIKTEMKPRQCKRKKKKKPKCQSSEYGCCFDGITPATGPFSAGCPEISTCKETKYGCCPDEVSPAEGPNNENCPEIACQFSLYGCCNDNKTVALGNDGLGCPVELTSTPMLDISSSVSSYRTEEISTTEAITTLTYSCSNSQFGCCPDNETSASGPNFSGCYETEGSGGYETTDMVMVTSTTTVSSVEENVTYAVLTTTPPPNETKPEGCEATPYGCCSDGKTPAQNESKICNCEATRYGCCPDGFHEAQGDDFAGCADIAKAAEMCSLPKETGSCREFTAKWFFDTEYGGCSRFWYGGCDGNDNRFKSQEDCKKTCVEPPGRVACYLPKITGPCDGYYPSWYYDPLRRQCLQFIYGGCLGNNNKFQTLQECESLCAQSNQSAIDTCSLPKDKGPCHGSEKRWYYNSNDKICKEFDYGGCLGNDNRFISEDECVNKCHVQSNEIAEDNETQPAEIETPEEQEVVAEEGNYAVLRCKAIGFPTPTIYWRRDNIIIDGSSDRYRVTDGILQIVGLQLADSGVYVCVADNGIATPAQKDYNLVVQPRVLEVDRIPEPPRVTEPTPPPTPPAPILQPQIDLSDPTDVEAEEGSYATLRCVATGIPTPTISWLRGSTIIDSSDARYKLNGGVLQIIDLYPYDAGSYFCIADNGKGVPARREYRLFVKDPVNKTADIISDVVQSIVVTMDASSILHCYAYGYPRPDVGWFKEDRMLPRNNEQYEQRRDHSLVIRRVTLRALGPYTCQAYNGLGKAASWTITLHGAGPATPQSADDQKFLIYLVPSPNVPIQFDIYNRPFYHEVTAVAPYVTQRGDTDRKSESPLTNEVTSSPKPDTEIYIDPKCTDNPYFANCALIVKANHCGHPYYSKFCCRSCALQQQLPPSNYR